MAILVLSDPGHILTVLSGAQLRREVLIVSDHDQLERSVGLARHGAAHVDDAPQRLRQRGGVCDVEIGGGLIERDHATRHTEGLCQRHADQNACQHLKNNPHHHSSFKYHRDP